MKYEDKELERYIEVHERVTKQVRFVAQALFVVSAIGMTVVLWWLL